MTTYDLALRTAKFAKSIRVFTSKIPRTVESIEDIKQLVRSSGSVAANYLEADEALSKKDFIMRIKICRKESRESGLWLSLFSLPETMELERKNLAQECSEFVRIFQTIVKNTKLE